MQQFPVPQFIDVEDKIIGPITTRQFILMLVAGLIGFLFYSFRFWIFIGLTAVDVTVFAVLAFVKINGMPVHFFLLNLLQTFRRPARRVWNKNAYVRDVKIIETSTIKTEHKMATKPPVSGSRLDDLTLIVNTGGVYNEDNINNIDQDITQK